MQILFKLTHEIKHFDEAPLSPAQKLMEKEVQTKPRVPDLKYNEIEDWLRKGPKGSEKKLIDLSNFLLKIGIYCFYCWLWKINNIFIKISIQITKIISTK